MSLDFTLYSKQKEIKECYHCCSEYEYQEEVLSLNITHNLSKMANECGLYDCLWNSHGLDSTEIVEDLRKGLEELTSNPEKYREFNPSNGWGNYDNLVRFSREILEWIGEEGDNYEISISK